MIINSIEFILIYIFGVFCIVSLMWIVGLKVEIRLYTLPSIFSPMPEDSVLKLKRKIEKLKMR